MYTAVPIKIPRRKNYSPRCSRCELRTDLVIDKAAGDVICTACGLVVKEHIISQNREWRIFQGGDKNMVRARIVTNGEAMMPFQHSIGSSHALKDTKNTWWIKATKTIDEYLARLYKGFAPIDLKLHSYRCMKYLAGEDEKRPTFLERAALGCIYHGLVTTGYFEHKNFLPNSLTTYIVGETDANFIKGVRNYANKLGVKLWNV